MAATDAEQPYANMAAGDPFTSSTSHRYSNFDSQLFALGPTTSPEQAKRALEAHLAETERRIQDASKLGTTLVQQRKELADRLKEIEKEQDEGEITPELRQKLVDIEKEYNEVGRESARAFLPKSRVSSSELAESPFPVQGKRSVSPSKFESQATASPSKLSVPNRKQRNQPSNRVHDIEFATEISTSLLSQVRHLQALLAEKEESLRNVNTEKARLEAEAEGFNQRLRALDESEQRYKDENWSLETQLHEHIATAKEAAAREKKLTQSLNALQVQKTTAQKDLDEMKLSHSKLSETHAAAVKHHDTELGGLKRNMAMVENERGALQRKIEDLTGQNHELAMAVARQRGIADEQESQDATDEDFETADDNVTPEHSPPPSPTKMTPRHSHLEAETLKSSLHHAHRMIQSLKGNIHREKTEKLELKRMLQDARDELEIRRTDAASGSIKKSRKMDSKEFKKLSKGQLGALRNSRSEISMNDAQWEDQDGESSPSRAASARVASMPGKYAESSGQFETCNETSDAFETANERDTETDDFHTGNEGNTDSDELTETESGANVSTIRGRPAPLNMAAKRSSFLSTASTSGDEYSYEELRTPVQSQPQRLRLRMGRGSSRRDRIASEEPSIDSSPAASNNGTPQQPGQSLFAELGDLGGSDDESAMGSSVDGMTPGRNRSITPGDTPGGASARMSALDIPPVPALPKPAMVDSSMMTDGWEPAPATPQSAVPIIASGLASGLVGAGLVEAAHQLTDNRLSVMSDVSTQAGDVSERLAEFPTPPTRSAPLPPLSISTIQAEDMMPVIPAPATPVQMVFSSIGTSHTEPLSPVLHVPTPVKLAFAPIEGTETEPIERPATAVKMEFSGIEAVAMEPVSPVLRPVTPVKLAFVPIDALDTEPISPIERAVTPVKMAFSSIEAMETEPISPVEKVVAPINMAFSSIGDTATEPESPVKRLVTPVAFEFSSVSNTETEPISPVVRPVTPPRPVTPVAFAFSSVSNTETEPISPIVRPVTPPRPITPIALAFSSITSTSTEPIEPPSPAHNHLLAGALGAGALGAGALGVGAFLSDKSDKELSTQSPETPKGKGNFNGLMSWAKAKTPVGPLIAEDETRQSPNQSPLAETPESQRPFKELSVNTNERPPSKAKPDMTSSTAQTSLTSEEIDEMLSRKSDRQYDILTEDSQKPLSPSRTVVPPTIRVRESMGSVRITRPKALDLSLDRENQPSNRPGSSGSYRRSISSQHPPLPPNHQQVIAAAQRVGSSSSNHTGIMGPPLLPASAYMNSNSQLRPRTPSSSRGPSSPKNGTTPRPRYPGGAELNPSITGRSRASSVTSFASEVESRFNLRGGPTEIPGVASGTDPRMIQAITQTMIGDYLWKYTRKAGRSDMSSTRHRRYFWVHPYTRTLYWSDRDPSTAGRSELKAKSVAIEAVRVVTDDNPMPPGLHRKSLVILTPGRSVKFTSQTGHNHEIWFNALSYLLLRTDDAPEDTADEAPDALTADDVDEFNPGFRSSRRGGAASLSSYNSRATRNESPAIPERPTLNNTPYNGTAASRGSVVSRLSNYWRTSNGEVYGARRSRQSTGQNSIYETSEVHDSAEDVRAMIEKQDRESDRLENVRACCDGLHDVGHLAHTPTSSVRNRLSQGTRSYTPGPGQRPGATSRQSVQ
ncbi:hypothetical protein VC83_02829 [Pseudogymnoascus destructans]|uniref:PH domain-containing protein n=2 Tax=Pseudogymnoascus destructans TaxID=655981 RepID=L8FWT4_PSED2|nr:uncharacterized protein VC83_02829 [Pseudogymnoascus destructans]ELR04943.1 hypothetical protein GMDG_00200 [Pseudogymnoascus destructans 20631-21]OAF60288.1 hypothetical protein VC83_02829 [Pseudogymnoascus destructans]